MLTGSCLHRLGVLCYIRPINVCSFTTNLETLVLMTLDRSVFQQDRQNPAAISRVFASGAMAGGICALLQTPVSEAIHCRMLCRIDTCNADRGH